MCTWQQSRADKSSGFCSLQWICVPVFYGQLTCCALLMGPGHLAFWRDGCSRSINYQSIKPHSNVLSLLTHTCIAEKWRDKLSGITILLQTHWMRPCLKVRVTWCHYTPCWFSIIFISSILYKLSSQFALVVKTEMKVITSKNTRCVFRRLYKTCCE